MKRYKYNIGGVFAILIGLFVMFLSTALDNTYSLNTDTSLICPYNWKYSNGRCINQYETLNDCNSAISNYNNATCNLKDGKYVALLSVNDYLSNAYKYINVSLNGGSINGDSDDRKIRLDYNSFNSSNFDIYYGGKIEFDGEITNGNLKLIGFAKNNQCNNEIYSLGDYIVSNGSDTLYACYSDSYSVNLIADNASEFTSKSYSANLGSSVTLPVVSRDGYTFLGWYDGNNNFVSSGNDNYVVSKSITLYSKFSLNDTINYNNVINDVKKDDINDVSLNSFYIMYEANKGSFFDGKKSTLIYYKMNEIPYAYKFIPIRDGYTFAGWYLEDKLYTFDSVLSDNIILKAKWIRTGTLSYLCNDNDYYDSVSDLCYKIEDLKYVRYDYDNNGNLSSCSGNCNMSSLSKPRIKLLTNSLSNNVSVSNVTGTTCNGNNNGCYSNVSTVTFTAYKPKAIVTLLDFEDIDDDAFISEDDFSDEFEEDLDFDEILKDESISVDNYDEGEILETGSKDIYMIISLILICIGIFIFNKDKVNNEW